MEALALVLYFLLYINAAAVAVNFHNVPLMVSGLFPALLIIPAAYQLIVRREKLIFPATVVLMLIFLLIQAVGGVLSKRPEVSVDKIVTFVFEAIIIYLLTVNIVRTPRMLRLTVGAVVLAGLFMGGLSIYQEITKTYDNNYWGFAQTGAQIGSGQEVVGIQNLRPRLTGPIGEENRYAQIMITTAPLALFMVASVKAKKYKLLMLVSVFFIVVGALLTYSRGAFIALSMAVVFMFLLRFIKLRYLSVVVLALVLVMLFAPNLTSRLSSLQSISLQGLLSEDSANDSLSSADGSIRSRATEMISAWLMFADYPMFGVGPGNYPYHYYDYASTVGIRVKLANRQPHILYGGIAAENGIFGLVIFFAIVGFTFHTLFEARRKWQSIDPTVSLIAQGLVISLIAYLFSGFFLHFAYIRYIWLIMALAAAAGALKPAQALSSVMEKEKETVRCDFPVVDGVYRIS